ncbi:MAG: hypothetical protein R3Y27_01900 [Clostridia bacterium]
MKSITLVGKQSAKINPAPKAAKTKPLLLPRMRIKPIISHKIFSRSLLQYTKKMIFGDRLEENESFFRRYKSLRSPEGVNAAEKRKEEKKRKIKEEKIKKKKENEKRKNQAKLYSIFHEKLRILKAEP